jgi:hypothetical protein
VRDLTENVLTLSQGRFSKSVQHNQIYDTMCEDRVDDYIDLPDHATIANPEVGGIAITPRREEL